MLRIKQILTEQGISNVELAQFLNVSPQYVSDVIHERKNITLKVALRFADALGIPLVALFDGYTPPQELPDASQSFCPFCGNTLHIRRN